MKKYMNYKLIGVLACSLVIAFGIGYYVSSAPTATSIGDNIQAKGTVCDGAGNCLGGDVLSGNTFTRWGMTTCPTSSQLVYEGYSAGGHYSHGNRGPICLSKNPTWDQYTDANNDKATIYGAEYETSGAGIASMVGMHNYEVPCAVCYSGSPTMMYPGSQTCPTGWSSVYQGYLMSGMYNQGGGMSEYVCVDRVATYFGSNANNNGLLFYPTEAECGALPCGPYVQNRELTCSVCAKD